MFLGFRRGPCFARRWPNRRRERRSNRHVRCPAACWVDLPGGAAGVAKDKLVRGQGDRFTDRVGGHSLGERGGGGSAACSGVPSKMVLLMRSTQPSSAAFVPSGLPTR